MVEKITPEIPNTWPPDYPSHAPIGAAEARRLDRAASVEFGLPEGCLMENASRAVAEIAASMSPPEAEIVVLCGPGNNGGDGFGAGRFLRAWRRQVRVLQMSPEPPASPSAQVQFSLAAAMGPIELAYERPNLLDEALAGRPGLVIDALFGVGLTRPLGAPWKGWIEALNASALAVLAVDLPSGMDSDTGLSLPVCVRALLTATMAAPKLGFSAGSSGTAAAGHIIEVDIGLPRPLLRELELPLP